LPHGRAGTIFVEPSGPATARPVGEICSCSAKPCTATGAAGDDCPASGGKGAPAVPAGPELPPGALPMPVVVPVTLLP
jgi:hypothetical protein